MPEIITIAFVASMADRCVFRARVRYEGERPMEVLFHGPTLGNRPVHFTIVGSGLDAHIVDPERFGEQFGREWIRAFYAPRTGGQ